MKYSTAVAALFVLASATTVQAQQAEKASVARPAAMGVSQIFSLAKGNVLKSADQMPEEKYSFQATKEVRTFGQLLGHIADANNFFCATISGTPKQYEVSAEKLATKAELTAALKASFDACDTVLANVTDADLARPVDIFGNKANVAAAMTLVASHVWEHYGNIVTYMRLNGMTPPSSQN
jgi:uncharacterized damage-inducible protein DinB